MTLEGNFNKNVFTREQAERFVAPRALDNIDAAVSNHTNIDPVDADAYARGLKTWAISQGASHFSHWFQPLTGNSSQKHVAFFGQTSRGVEAAFSGKMLSKSETDGSSYPNGDLRCTHEARGYTIWDPSSLPFLYEHGNGSTAMIPALFFSWKGHALDYKIPLLRSESALVASGKRLFKAFRMKTEQNLVSFSGAEQEYFLIDRDYYLKRPDLVSCGRTLIGAQPPKGQSLSDQYFADASKRSLAFVNEAEVEMWKLGINQTTRHREVAPGQYEVAPEFAKLRTTCDHNLQLMEVMQHVARKHHLSVLFHEKPFAGINGSGKHNNWSVGTDTLGTLFAPGPNPNKNRLFLTFTIATLRSVHLHGDLLRLAISGAGNDHRLGGHEAPPAIMSVYLGKTVYDALEAFGNKREMGSGVATTVNLGVAGVPTFERDPTDRNRTSPMAFTGNRFEFRAVGSSQNVGRSSAILNAVFCDSLDYIADAVEKASANKATGKSHEDVIDEVLRDLYHKHKAIVFEGNGYSDEWKAEAKRRGLPSFVSTPDVLPEFAAKKNVDLLSRLGILSEEEIIGHRDVMFAEYITKLKNEAACMLGMYHHFVAPAGFNYQTGVAASVTAVAAAVGGAGSTGPQSALLSNITKGVNDGVSAAADLQSALNELNELDASGAGLHVQAKFAQEKLKASMSNLRRSCDATERSVPASSWTLPTYHQMLFHQD